MRLFDVQGTEIQASRDKLFNFVRDPRNLPKWARAFQSADHQRARLETRSGAVKIGLRTDHSSRSRALSSTKARRSARSCRCPSP